VRAGRLGQAAGWSRGRGVACTPVAWEFGRDWSRGGHGESRDQERSERSDRTDFGPVGRGIADGQRSPGATSTNARDRDRLPRGWAAALALAARGWAVFPLRPGDKRPRVKDWEAWATVDVERIGRWWARHRADNVGVASGPAGLVVVDIDTPKPGQVPPEAWRGAADGIEVLARLAARYGPAPATFTVATPRGGRHLYYRDPTGDLRNTKGKLGWCIDTRAAGGYVVGPGSVLDTGGAYTVVDASPVAELPGWITAQLLAPPPAADRRCSPAAARPSGRYGDAALVAEVARVADAGPGARNEALRAAAWNLGRLVARGVLARADVEGALQAAAEASGYRDGPKAAAAVIRSALDKRTRHRAAPVAPVEPPRGPAGGRSAGDRGPS
jgi:Bifunctional DNA primase/polymerase, N-terminal